MTEQEARTKDSTIDDLFSLACKYADEATKAESRVAELEKQVEDLKCCGNCKNYGYTEKYCPHKEEMFAKEYYDCWQSDGLKRSERV